MKTLIRYYVDIPSSAPPETIRLIGLSMGGFVKATEKLSLQGITIADVGNDVFELITP